MHQLIHKHFRIPLTPMGVLAPGSAHARPSTRPHRHERTCKCLQSHLQTSLPTPQKSYPKFLNPRTTFQNTPFSVIQVPQLLTYIFGSFIYCELIHIHFSTYTLMDLVLSMANMNKLAFQAATRPLF